MNNHHHQDSLREEMEIIEEFTKQLTSIYYLYNKLQDKLEEKNKLISLLTRDLYDSKKEMEELHVTIEFYKGKNIELQNYLDENNKKLDETRHALVSEIKRLQEENYRYEENRIYQETTTIRRPEETNYIREESMCTASNDDSFRGFNSRIRPIDRNGNIKR
jgi:hypothetical protein